MDNCVDFHRNENRWSQHGKFMASHGKHRDLSLTVELQFADTGAACLEFQIWMIVLPDPIRRLESLQNGRDHNHGLVSTCFPFRGLIRKVLFVVW